MPKSQDKIISLPYDFSIDVSQYVEDYHFGYFEAINSRPTQEDALSWQILYPQDLTPSGALMQLGPKAMGHRLWTSYQLLDQRKHKGGTTASTTVYDGKGNLITATLADAAAFAALHDKSGNVLGVIRLNSKTHKPYDPIEKQRITAAGGKVFNDRLNGILAVSRAIGDHQFKGICSEPTIDIITLEKLADKLHFSYEDIGKFQIISTCDGFTDGAEGDTKEDQEHYLLEILKTTAAKDAKTEEELARVLATEAMMAGSEDNISVAIQSMTKESSAFLLGVFDGHNGSEVSEDAAKNIGLIFIQQCRLTPENYAKQKFSFNKREATYKRDNFSIEFDEDLDKDQNNEAFIRDSVDSQTSFMLHAIENQNPKRTEGFVWRFVNSIKCLAENMGNLFHSVAASLRIK